ncbi:MAG: OmpH family outer membrane protein [Ideonella sp.]|nr:OmpH family outer membrane protein [Ideonella sp.]
MKSSLLLKLTAAAALLALPPLVAAQELRIGYVSGERVLRDSAPAKAAQAKLEAEFSKRQKDIEEIAARLKASSEKLEKDAPTLSEAERSRRQRDLVEQDREFQRKRREFQEDLNQRKNEELGAVVERANKAIKQIFDAEKYDLIIQDATFYSPRVDITEKVIKALNAQAGK